MRVASTTVKTKIIEIIKNDDGTNMTVCDISTHEYVFTRPPSFLQYFYLLTYLISYYHRPLPSVFNQLSPFLHLFTDNQFDFTCEEQLGHKE